MRFQGKSLQEMVAYFDSISIKPYDPVFGGTGELAITDQYSYSKRNKKLRYWFTQSN